MRANPQMVILALVAGIHAMCARMKPGTTWTLGTSPRVTVRGNGAVLAVGSAKHSPNAKPSPIQKGRHTHRLLAGALHLDQFHRAVATGDPMAVQQGTRFA